MLVRLFKSHLVKTVLKKCSGSHSSGCLIGSFRLMSDSSSSSFFNHGVAKQIGGGMRQSLLIGLWQVSSVRQYHNLLVKYLPLGATEESLRQHFSQCGMVLTVRIVRDAKTMESREHGYVVFADKEALEKALNSQPHLIGNKQVAIRPAQEINFLVTELSSSSTEESLQAHFSRYGTVLRCNLKSDPIKRVSQCCVHFAYQVWVDECIATSAHVIDGKKVKVVRLSPKELTLHVGYLSPATTNQSLHSFYSQFGNLLQAEVIRDRWTGLSRCFGFVCFSSQQELESAMRSVPHMIDGKEVEINCNNREFLLFIGGLPPNMSEHHLKEYFERFGPVCRCKIARDKQTNQSLYHGWVTFSSLQGLENALAARPLVIDGKQIDSRSGRNGVREACTLFVGCLSAGTTDKMLYEAFSKFGTVVESEVKLHLRTGQSRRYGFVAYSSPNEIDSKQLSELYNSLDVCTTDSRLRLNTVFCKGVDKMSDYELEKIFAEFNPDSVQFVDESSCTIRWSSPAKVAQMLLQMTKPLRRVRQPRKAEEGELMESEDEEEVGQLKEEDGEDVAVVEAAKVSKKRKLSVDCEAVEVNIEEVRLPAGKWRVVTRHVPENRLLVVRYATGFDIRRGIIDPVSRTRNSYDLQEKKKNVDQGECGSRAYQSNSVIYVLANLRAGWE